MPAKLPLVADKNEKVATNVPLARCFLQRGTSRGGAGLARDFGISGFSTTTPISRKRVLSRQITRLAYTDELLKSMLSVIDNDPFLTFGLLGFWAEIVGAREFSFIHLECTQNVAEHPHVRVRVFVVSMYVFRFCVWRVACGVWRVARGAWRVARARARVCELLEFCCLMLVVSRRNVLDKT